MSIAISMTAVIALLKPYQEAFAEYQPEHKYLHRKDEMIPEERKVVFVK